MSDAVSATPLQTSSVRRVCGALLLAMAAVWAWLVFDAPIDSRQGFVGKILYVHPPCAFAAYLGFALTAFYGAMYLWRGDEKYDRRAYAAAGVGVLFATLMLLTGPIWGKVTWGKWWSWDLRLTLTLLLYLVYVSYLLLRAFTEGSERTARFAAVYGIAGLVVIPLNYFAIDLSGGRAIHPENINRDSLGPGIRAPFWMSVATCLMAYVYLWFVRSDVLTLRDAVARQEAGEAA